jgi:hypothetical protein
MCEASNPRRCFRGKDTNIEWHPQARRTLSPLPVDPEVWTCVKDGVNESI